MPKRVLWRDIPLSIVGAFAVCYIVDRLSHLPFDRVAFCTMALIFVANDVWQWSRQRAARAKPTPPAA